MARNRLTARQVQVASAGDHLDGDGLLLRVQSDRGSWVFRYTAPDGRRREMGLGKVTRNNIAEAGKSLTLARDLAEDARKQLRVGLDPIAERERQRDEARRALETEKRERQSEQRTLARVARQYHERVIEPARSTKHAADWINSLEQHVPDAIWHAPIDRVEPPQLLDFFVDIRRRRRETGRRIVQRLCKIYGDAEFRGWCRGNPAAAAAGKVREMGIRRHVTSYSALPFREVPAFMAKLRKREGVAARALEFAVLCAARTGEVLGATWGEFDLNAATWTVPAARMKGGQQHVVHLSPRALEIVNAMRIWQQPFVFPGPNLDGQPLSNMAMLTLLRRMEADKRTTVHGLCRASFSTWAHETGAARPDVIEACLAHREVDRVKAAYNRAHFMQERNALLVAWANFLSGRVTFSNVFELCQRAA